MTMQSEAVDKIIPALIKARGAFAAAVKGKTNPHFKSAYAPLDEVVEAVTPALLENGIFPTQQTEVGESCTILHTRFLHISGQWIGSTYPVHPIKSDPQAEGSALTYARRYALMALAGIAPEDDDDGEKAADATRKTEAQESAVVQEWIDTISGCDSADSLAEVGKGIAQAKVSSAGKVKLRAAFAAQKHALDKVAA